MVLARAGQACAGLTRGSYDLDKAAGRIPAAARHVLEARQEALVGISLTDSAGF